jgi:tetratricopeptide (TPR) repeat protein
LPGTCDWIRTNTAFLKWNESSSTSISDRLLCISGTHGCGKTILASSIIEHLKSVQLQTIFFYFSGKNAGLKSLDGIVRTFLWQLLEEATDEQSLKLISHIMLRGPPAVTDLVHVLKNMAALMTSPVGCVIDGVDEYLDECNDSIQDLLQLVHGLLDANSNFRVILLGRQHVLQPHILQAAIGATPERIDISSDIVKQDISTFIDAEIDAKIHGDLLNLPGLRDSISKTLQEKSDGMFLWVELMIKDLSKSDSPFEVKERLRNPPRNLEGIYRHLLLRLLQRLDKVQLNLARKTLAFTIVSCRTFDVSELQYAHALDSGSSTFKEHLLLHPNQSILDVCGDFINIKDGFVQLIHFSVQEFLTRPEDEWHCSDDREIMCFRVDLEPSHRSLGSACVDYLGMCEYGSPLSDTDAFLKLAKDYPFIRYASQFVISHLNQSGPLCSSTAGKIRAFLGSEKYAFWLEYLAMLVLEDASISVLGEEFERFISRLDMGEYKRKTFGNDLRMYLHQELERRIRAFGEQDPRTEQWQSLLYIIQDAPLMENGDEDSDHKLSTTQTTWLPSTEEPSLSHITNALIHNQTLPLHRQIDILLRLESHLRRVKTLTDPLKILFRLILQKSHSIPIYVLLAVAHFYFSLDKLEEALEVYRAALKKIEAQETPMKFLIVSKIGKVLREQKNYEEAVAMYRRSVEGRERLLGKENKDTLRDSYWLGYVLVMQGHCAEAEALYRQIIETSRRTFGGDHRETLWNIYGLADALGKQNKYSEAEALYRQLVEKRGRVLGTEHKDTVDSAYWLAYMLSAQKKYAHAEIIYRQTFEIQERTLGKEHEDTLDSAYWLADMLSAQKKYGQAEIIYRQTFEIREKTLGKEHEDTLESAECLADTLWNQQKYGEAEVLYRQTHEAKVKTLGKDNEDTLSCADYLGYILDDLGKYAEAESLFRQTLEGMENVLGKEHRDTLRCAHNLGLSLNRQKKCKEGEQMYRRVLETQQRVLGKDDPDTLLTINNLGAVLHNQEEYAAAEEMYRRALEGRRTVLGIEHPATLWSMNDLALLLYHQGEYGAAEDMYQGVLEKLHTVLGKEYPDAAQSAKNLEGALDNEEDYESAEEIYWQARKGLKEVLEGRLTL